MDGRAVGVRGSRTLFSTGADAVNKNTVRTLVPLAGSEYDLIHVTQDTPIKEWVEECGHTYRIGRAFYELTKTETIQRDKQVAVLEVATGRVYTGPQARDIIGLQDVNVRVKPDANKDYKIFVQSKSVNRKLIAHTKLLVLTGAR
jgi:hypothetical protein